MEWRSKEGGLKKSCGGGSVNNDSSPDSQKSEYIYFYKKGYGVENTYVVATSVKL